MARTPLIAYREIKTLLVRIRNEGHPYGTGTGIKFTSEDLTDSTQRTALDKFATWINLTMDK